ncbi:MULTISPECIES: alpha/beta hydrolase [Myroides]|uniref:Alpha/beta hydrolase n=1 Tax=Myroides albus TaxID=2562892 RepID=A0A6I3LL90_9FLAO|nr:MULTISPECIES: alpha/beta hydrolase-fold protein [Myroides]MTG97281.1 alpha/beta hydrolase [Myroides albus]MVX34954.1 alpha/beta hydrolase [Myroides sp. LoEW2-1]UVD80632.1 alpha/beta hydrolase-fold protein [Myroides albus]
MFRKLLLLAVLSLSTIAAKAQNDIAIGKMYKLNSKQLNEDREIQIYLPKSYTDTTITPQQYPVIYLLDGESNFNYLTAYVEKLSKYPYPSIPEMIVVGIVNTNRTRDLTPSTRKEENMTEAQKSKIKGESGGNANFFSFIEKELMPYINENYRTMGYNVLIGHSFGGITALNNLLNYTDMFHAYIVHDPSIWWDGQYMLKQYELNPTKDFKNRKLFVTQVDESQNKGGQKEHYSSIQEYNQYMTKTKLKNLSYKYVQYEGEDHGSIPLKGNLDGLRYIFEGFGINFKQIKENPKLVEENYKSFSQKMHFEFKPNEAYLNYIIDYYKKMDEQDTVKYFEQYRDKLHQK